MRQSHVLYQHSFSSGDLTPLREFAYKALSAGTMTLSTAHPSIFDGQNLTEVTAAAREWKCPYIQQNTSVYFIDAQNRLVRISAQGGSDAVIFEAISAYAPSEGDLLSSAANEFILSQQRMDHEQMSRESGGIISSLQKLFRRT